MEKMSEAEYERNKNRVVDFVREHANLEGGYPLFLQGKELDGKKSEIFITPEEVTILFSDPYNGDPYGIGTVERRQFSTTGEAALAAYDKSVEYYNDTTPSSKNGEGQEIVSPFLSIVVPDIQKFVNNESRVHSDDPKEQEAYIIENYVKRSLSRMADQWTQHHCFQQPLIRLFDNDEWLDISNDIESLNAYLSACKGKFFEKRLEFVSDCLKKSLKMRKAFGNEFLTFRVTNVSGGFECWIHFKDKYSIKLLNDMVE